MRGCTRTAFAAPILAAALAAAPAAADSDSCREWRADHWRWTAEVLRLHLRGDADRQVDEALFELLQREAWLTSCEQTARASRSEMIGWRLVGRSPDEYAAAVLESLLDRGGFDLEFDGLLDGPGPAEMAPPRRGERPRLGRRAAR